MYSTEAKHGTLPLEASEQVSKQDRQKDRVGIPRKRKGEKTPNENVWMWWYRLGRMKYIRRDKSSQDKTGQDKTSTAKCAIKRKERGPRRYAPSPNEADQLRQDKIHYLT